MSRFVVCQVSHQRLNAHGTQLQHIFRHSCDQLFHHGFHEVQCRFDFDRAQNEEPRHEDQKLPELGERDDDHRRHLSLSMVAGDGGLRLELRLCSSGPTHRRHRVDQQYGWRVQLHRLHPHMASASSAGVGVGDTRGGCRCW